MKFRSSLLLSNHLNIIPALAQIMAYRRIYASLGFNELRPGGNFWDCSPGARSLTQLTTTHFESTSDLTRMGGYQISSPKNDHQATHPFGNSKVILTGIGNGCCIFKMISRKELIQLRLSECTASKRTYDIIITSLVRQNDVAAALWRNNDPITASRVHCILHVMSAGLCVHEYSVDNWAHISYNFDWQGWAEAARFIMDSKLVHLVVCFTAG